MADKKKADASAAPAPDPALLIDHLRAQLTQRADEVLASRGEAQALTARVAALQGALADSEASGREVAEMGSRLAKEREAFLQAELAARDAELARLREALVLATERVMEVQRESEAALRAKAQQLSALRSRMDDITDKFNDDLSDLKRRLDTRLGLLNAEVEEGGSGNGRGSAQGSGEGGGMGQAGMLAAMAAMQKEIL